MAVALHVDGVGKCYPVYRSLFHRMLGWIGVPIKPSKTFWAVRDVSFDVKPGTTLSIIGQNGAGKSTLLKLITGTVRPSKGQIAYGGRISSILELDIGFNPDLTGHENIYHCGGLMGFSTGEIAELLPEIIAFSELGHFFEEPVRVYSSGMKARLAFALATARRPEILIVDEVLSVGDTYFQHKSFKRIREFKEQGSTIIMVTHSMQTVKEISDRVIYLENGVVLKDGFPDEVVDFYNAKIAEKENSKLSISQRRAKDGWLHTEFGDGRAKVLDIRLVDPETQQDLLLVNTGQAVEIRTMIQAVGDVENLVVGHRISDKLGHIVYGTNTWHHDKALHDLKDGDIINTAFKFECDLGPGSYSVSFGLHSHDTHLQDCYHKADNAVIFDVANPDKPFFMGSSSLNGDFEVLRGPA